MTRWMIWARFFAFLLLFPLVVWAQEEDEDEDEGESVIEMGEEAGDDGDDYRGIRIEPFPPTVPAEQEEPNRPAPVVVGEWQPPVLKKADQVRLDALRARRADNPDDVDPRFSLAEFYLRVLWLPHAEAEFLACAKLDPESIRPWEGLLRVYAAKSPEAEPELPAGLILPPGFPAAQRRQLIRQINGIQEDRPDWIPSDQERSARVARALAEVVKRRPDDVARRRQLLDHFRNEGRYDRAAEQAREILKRVPGDAQTRFELVQSIIYLRRDNTENTEWIGEVRALLEDNIKRAPDHAPSLIRLARVLAVQEGSEARERIATLQKRAFLRLFLVPELGSVPYREDTFRMAKNLSGKKVADEMWDGAMQPPGYSRRDNPDAGHVTRWLEPFKFPHSAASDRERVVRTLARRGDAAAAVVILSYLWHAEDLARYRSDQTQFAARQALERVEQSALEAVGGLGEAAFPAAERFLQMADTSPRRRRGVAALRLIGDRRGAGALIDALEWDTDPEVSFGVAAALEALGEPRAVDALVAAALNVRLPLARRREAAEALAAFQDPRAVEAINVLQKKNEGFETISAYALFRLTKDEAALGAMVRFVEEDGGSLELLRLAGKCPDPRIKRVHLAIMRKSRDPELREATLREIRRRFWKESRAEVEAIFLKEAESVSVSKFVLRELGEIGGEVATTRLLKLLDDGRLHPEHWAAACRALARTGDDRAVRWFSRRKVLEKDPGKRKLAARLYTEAAKRRAERLRQQ
jgi:HEAT repeat protein